MSVDYHAYLRSPEWQVIRRLALERDGGCVVCYRADRLDVHHRTYERLGHELLSDVTVLCRDCHAKHHDKLPAAPVALADEPKITPDDGPPLHMSRSEREHLDRIADESFGTVQTLRKAA